MTQRSNITFFKTVIKFKDKDVVGELCIWPGLMAVYPHGKMSIEKLFFKKIEEPRYRAYVYYLKT